MACFKRWSKRLFRIRSSACFWRCISLSKDTVLKRSFLCIIILALVLCLIIYNRSVFTSGTHYFHRNLNWRHLVSNISDQTSDVSSKLMNKITFLSEFIDDSPDEDYELGTDFPSDTPFEKSVESFVERSVSYVQNLGLHQVWSANHKKQYLIYLCDHTAWCGGWGDRQRGVVSLYLLSLAYNRSFGIRMTSPCDLEQFYEPNEIPWIVTEREIQNKSSRVIYSIDSDPSKVDKRHELKEDVIYIQTNMDNIRAVRRQFKAKMPKFVLNRNRPAIFRRVWKQLMKPTPRLQKRLDDLIYSGNTDGALVCAHVRIGFSKTLPNDPPRLEFSSVEKVWKFMEKFKNVRKYFVATDNDDVRKSARERFGHMYVDTGGTILHIDRQRKKDAACEGFETAILDQLILTKCDILVISASNFSIRGAMLKTVLRNIFMFDGTTIEQYSPMNHFRYRRHVGSHDGMKKYTKGFVKIGEKLVQLHVLPHR